MLTDGTYDVFVVDADRGEGDQWHLELTVLAGAHKGEMVSVLAAGLAGDEFDLMGMPGTLEVENGEPAFRIDS